MTFYSFKFIVFFAIILVLLVFFKLVLKSNEKISKLTNQFILLISGYVFMGLADWRFCISLLFLTVVTYLCALGIRKYQNKKRIFLTIGLIVAIAMLVVYKYLNFFIDSFCKIFGVTENGGINLIIPLGISFFTFTAISYLADVYKGKITASEDFVKIALYISFFPKLIAGPIVRSTEFFLQLNENRTVSLKNLETGIQIFAFGLFKKIVLADHLMVFVNDVFAAPNAYNSFTVILSVISYSLQIYLDFSGYSDMAIGIAKCLGYDFNRNFNMPYISRNITEFWKRWHISLSSWLQDYLYIPLGGNRKGYVRTYLNLIITMLIGGLWHGANWTFVIWGLLFGIGLCVHKIFMLIRKNKSGDNKFVKGISVLATYLFVSVCWIFFRADNIGNAFDVLKKVFVWSDGICQIYSWSIAAIIIVVAATVVGVLHNRKDKVYDKKGNLVISGFYPILNLNKFWSLTLFITFVGLTVILAYTGNSPFIYGKF